MSPSGTSYYLPAFLIPKNLLIANACKLYQSYITEVFWQSLSHLSIPSYSALILRFAVNLWLGRTPGGLQG